MNRINRTNSTALNYYLLVLWRILLVYTLYTLSRLFFIFLNYKLLSPLSFGQFWRIAGGGLMFDTTAILYTNILYIFLALIPAAFVFKPLYQKIIKIIYITFNFIALSVNFADSIYFKFTLRRTSMTFLEEFKGDVHFFRIFIDSIGLYWYVFLLAIIFLFILIYFSGSYKKIYKTLRFSPMTNCRSCNVYIIQFLVLAFISPLIIIGIRGGVTRTIRPITLSNAGDFVDRAIHTSAVLNTPFSIIRTLGKRQYTKQTFYENYNSIQDIYTPEHYPINDTTNTSIIFPTTKEKKNVVFLIMESFGAENMYFLNKNLNKNYTPFLDSLRKRGVLCTNAFANGRKSIDAVPSILASIPSLMESFAVTPYANDQLQGIPRIMDSLGYYTAFFHGAPNNSMGIRAVSNLCGIKNYFGKDDYNNNDHFDGAWGIWDEYFLQFVASKISTFKQPFFASVFTLSSHHPFKVPDNYKNVLPEGEVPLQKAIAYADMSLRMFFKTIEKEAWFKNTIFVITPDHSTLWGIYPKYINTLGNTMIPIIYYSPGFITPGEYTKTTQQLDIMPTVLSMLSYDKPFFAFGRSLVKDNKEPFAVNFGSGEFQLVKGDTLYVRDQQKLKAVYNYKTDSLLQHNLLDQSAGALLNMKNVDKADGFFKAVIQQYMNRLIDDKLTVKQK